MATPIVGGDEVNAIVIDVGSLHCKAGYAGEDTPKAVFGTALGEVPQQQADAPMDVDEDPSQTQENGGSQKASEPGGSAAWPWRKRSLQILTSAHTRPVDHQEVRYTMQNGAVSDWDLWGAVIEEAVTKRLRSKPEEHPMLLAEPTYVSKDAREKMVEIMFEEFRAPATFLAKNAVLSSFALGRQTSLVVDMGHEGTVVSAVHDGYVLNASVMRSPVGGALLNEGLLASLSAKGGAIHPRYMYKKINKTGGVAAPENVLTAVPEVTASAVAWATAAVVADIKESHCRAIEVPFNEEENLNMPVQTYELPDGSLVDIGVERFKIPELLFNPALIKTIPGMRQVHSYSGGEIKSVQEMVIDSVNSTDVDIRKELFGGVVLTGGSSLFQSTKDRLDRELLDLAPQAAKVKVTTHQNATERKFSVWLGGSILGSLGSFHQLWMSRQEYDEHGAALIHRKSP